MSETKNNNNSSIPRIGDIERRTGTTVKPTTSPYPGSPPKQPQPRK